MAGGNPGWFLIMDNADDLYMAQGFLPGRTQGHLLLTTQAQSTGMLAENIPVEEMTAEDGALLVLRRAGAIANDRVIADADEADRWAALELSMELGRLPLVVDQAGAFMEEMHLSVSESFTM